MGYLNLPRDAVFELTRDTSALIQNYEKMRISVLLLGSALAFGSRDRLDGESKSLEVNSSEFHEIPTHPKNSPPKSRTQEEKSAKQAERKRLKAIAKEDAKVTKKEDKKAAKQATKDAAKQAKKDAKKSERKEARKLALAS